MDQLTKNKEPDPLVSIEVSSARSSASNRSDISGGALSPDFAFSPFSHGYYSPSPSYRTRSRQSSGSNASSSISNPRRISLAAGERATSYQYYAKSNSLSSHSSPFGDANHHGRYSVDGKMKAFRGMKLSSLRPISIKPHPLDRDSQNIHLSHLFFRWARTGTKEDIRELDKLLPLQGIITM